MSTKDNGAASGLQNAKKSWAEVLTRNIQGNGNNRNVIEVMLEKDERGPFKVTQEECVRLMSKVGIDVRPGIHVEEIQICPNGRGIIFITLKQEISIQQFCQYNVIEVNSNGVRAVNIKPAFKREVVVSLRNIHPNTKDEYVINYLNRFGKVVSNKVVYGVYAEGPLKGFRNGDRSFKVELKPQINLGTYHVLDGQKVIVKHEGQLQTCARCLESARTCKGRGTARRCEEQGGVKADFTKYIKDLWNDIGYCPESDIQEIPTDEYEDEYDPNILRQIGGGFTPQSSKHQDRIDAYSGINLRSFSKDTDQCEIVDLLISAGLPVHNGRRPGHIRRKFDFLKKCRG